MTIRQPCSPTTLCCIHDTARWWSIPQFLQISTLRQHAAPYPTPISRDRCRRFFSAPLDQTVGSPPRATALVEWLNGHCRNLRRTRFANLECTRCAGPENEQAAEAPDVHHLGVKTLSSCSCRGVFYPVFGSSYLGNLPSPSDWVIL